MYRGSIKCGWVMDGAAVIAFGFGASALPGAHGPDNRSLWRKFNARDELDSRNKPVGSFESRRLTDVPAEFTHIELEDRSYVVSSFGESAAGLVEKGLHFNDVSGDTVTSWNRAGFALRSRGADVAKARQLEAAIWNSEAMWAYSLMPHFGLMGLGIAIRSRVPAHLRTVLHELA